MLIAYCQVHIITNNYSRCAYYNEPLETACAEIDKEGIEIPVVKYNWISKQFIK